MSASFLQAVSERAVDAGQEEDEIVRLLKGKKKKKKKHTTPPDADTSEDDPWLERWQWGHNPHANTRPETWAQISANADLLEQIAACSPLEPVAGWLREACVV